MDGKNIIGVDFKTGEKFNYSELQKRQIKMENAEQCIKKLVNDLYSLGFKDDAIVPIKRHCLYIYEILDRSI